MPLPILLAMALAFGLGLPADSRPLSGGELAARLAEAALGVAVVGMIGAAFGAAVASWARRPGASSRVLRLYLWGSRVVVAAGLGVFAWTLFLGEWTRVVDRGLHLRGVVALEEVAVLLPYVAGQMLAWCGLYRAEKALRARASAPGLRGFLFRRVRQSFGMVLPVAFIYVLGRDVMGRLVPDAGEDAAIQFAGSCVLALIVFVLSPFFVRLTWPTRRLPDGPLRDRLERLSRRLNFRCTDLRVWDTGGLVINAGVTGAVPWFRYVLISDAMIDLMDDREIDAVFGHEVGHVAHRHMPYFALFLLGSVGLLTLGGTLLARVWDYPADIERLARGNENAALILEGVGTFLAWGLYFYFAFGALSRRFERQADVFGARAVSCGRADCPPHEDPNAPGAAESAPTSLCPEGIRTFSDALANVAILNGMSTQAGSWRHGSIAGRIAFLETLTSRPEAERRFEAGVLRLRWGVALGLGVAGVAAAMLAS